MTSATDVEFARVRPNWVALSAVLGGGLAAGLLPFLLYMRASYLLLPYSVYAIALLGWRAHRFADSTDNATQHPDFLEWVLAAWNAVGAGAGASSVGFLWYGLAWALVWGSGKGAHAIGWGVKVNPASGAMYASVFFVGLFALALPFIAAAEIPPKLYPRTAGTRSAYFPLTVNAVGVAAVTMLGLAGVVVGVAFLDVHGLGFALTLLFFMGATAGHLMDLREGEQSTTSATTVMKACSTLLSAAGYKVTERPRTGNPEVDPLIQPVDLLVSSGDHGYAIKVKVVSATKTELQWTEASDIRRAAKALQRVLSSSSSTEGLGIEGYLLVIGGQISDDLRSFSMEEGVKLVHLPSAEPLWAAVQPGAPVADLGMIGVRLLQVPPVMQASVASSMTVPR